MIITIDTEIVRSAAWLLRDSRPNDDEEETAKWIALCDLVEELYGDPFKRFEHYRRKHIVGLEAGPVQHRAEGSLEIPAHADDHETPSSGDLGRGIPRMTKARLQRRKKALRFWRAYADRPYLPVPDGVWFRVQDVGTHKYDERLMYGRRPWRQ